MAATATTITCPQCQRRFRIPEERLGQRVRCKCGEKFVAGATSVPAAPPEDQASALLDALDEITPPLNRSAPPPAPASPKPRKIPRPRTTAAGATPSTKSGRSIGLTLAAVGMMLEAIGGVLIVAALAVIFTSILTGGIQPRAGAGPASMLLVGVGLFGLGVLALLVGPLLFLAAPNAAGRGAAVVAIGSFVASVAAPAFLRSIAPPLVTGVTSALLVTVAMASLIGFYRNFASYLRQETLEQKAASLTRLFVFIIVGQIAAIVVHYAVPNVGGVRPAAFIVLAVLVAQGLLIVGYIILSGRMALAAFRR